MTRGGNEVRYSANFERRSQKLSDNTQACQKYISRRFPDKSSLFFIKRTMCSTLEEKHPYSSGLMLKKSQGGQSSESGKVSKNTYWIIWKLDEVEVFDQNLFLWSEEWCHLGPNWETLKCCHFSGWRWLKELVIPYCRKIYANIQIPWQLHGRTAPTGLPTFGIYSFARLIEALHSHTVTIK